MATHDYTVGGSTEFSALDIGNLCRKTIEVDCTDNTVASADIAKIMDIPAGTFILAVAIEAETVEDSTLTVDVGDFLAADDTVIDKDGWIDGHDCEATTKAASLPATLSEGAPNTVAPVYAIGKFYAAASWLGVTFNNAADTALIKVHVLCVAT